MLDRVLAQLGDDHRQAGGDVGREQPEAAAAGPPTPRPRTRRRRPTIRSRPSATWSNSTISSKAWDSVSCTMAIEATRDMASLSATLRLGRLDPAGLHPQQRRDRLQVVLHPVVDLPDGRVLGDQLAFLAAQVADVAAEHDRPRPAPDPASSGSTRTIRCASPETSSVRRAMRPGQHRLHRVVDRAGSGGKQLRRSASARCSSTRSPISPSRRYALSAFGLAYSTSPAASIRMNPSPTRGLKARLVTSPGSRERPDGDHQGQLGGGVQVGLLQRAGGAYAELAGVLLDHRDHPVVQLDRNRVACRPGCRPAACRRWSGSSRR